MKLISSFLSILLLLFVPVAFSQDDAPETEGQEKSVCCYHHERVQGLCQVTPVQEETCESILEYLNSPGTSGKTYCGGTKVRGGWTSVDCEQPAKGDEEQESTERK